MVNITIKETQFEGVYFCETPDGTSKLCTKNLAPGHSVYGEKLYRIKDVEYREWNAYRSKLAGAILKGLKKMPIKLGSKVLYRDTHHEVPPTFSSLFFSRFTTTSTA